MPPNQAITAIKPKREAKSDRGFSMAIPRSSERPGIEILEGSAQLFPVRRRAKKSD
jgi:hypothetical protein